ncbi:major facilitator superfamily domain-containing protein 6-A-like [Scylla paramamosain]|uniref:major facilitator superfamily domain-containing protein 6-A-like n=1 Tax=Scylla paramamosain TaxID=85552 RepID=UPI0030829BBD
MRINKKLIAIKAHYFCLLGSHSTVLPFVMVMATQLGVPVSVSGTLNASSLIIVLFFKPIIATIADTFPSLRRTIFLVTMCVSSVSLGCIYFVPSMQDIPRLHGQLVSVTQLMNFSDPTYLFSGKSLDSKKSAKNYGECYMISAVDCMATCTECSIHTLRFNLAPFNPTDMSLEENEMSEVLRMNMTHLSTEEPPEVMQHYLVKGLSDSSDKWQNISIECPRPEWEGPSCQGVLGRWQFWMFGGLLIVGAICVSTDISFTDAIIMDLIGKDGNYGFQRAWGTIGWGVISGLNGFLIDYWSGSSLDKNWAPAFVVFTILCLADVLLSGFFLKVPEIKSNKPVLEEVLPLLRKPHFIVFCIFTMIAGMFDGFCVYFLLLMQEDMARGTSALNNLRMLQGITLFVQCSVEAPLMFVNHWFMRRFGAQRVISLVFLLYVVRLFGLAATGAWGPIWSTLVVELLNGPCYGLGFTAVVVYAANVSPKGTNTTVQSLIGVVYESCGYALSLLLGGQMCERMGCPTMYLLLGIFSVVICLLHVGSLCLWPSLNADKKSKHTTGDQGVQDCKMDKDKQSSEIRERTCDEDCKMDKDAHISEMKESVCKKDDVIEVTRL